jgi:hypothetical protein
MFGDIPIAGTVRLTPKLNEPSEQVIPSCFISRQFYDYRDWKLLRTTSGV